MKYIVSLLLSILTAGVLPKMAWAVDFESCNMCHKEILENSKARLYLHTPFAENGCEECHVADESITLPIPDSSKHKKKIKRLADSGQPDNLHWFLLPAEKVGDTLLVDLQGENGLVSRKEVVVPPLADIAEVEGTGQPPVISNVQVTEVQRRVFISATIGWQTNALTDAQVLYGIKDLSQKSDPTGRLGRQHLVTIFNLKPGQVYNCSVVSSDLFGRKQASKPFQFSTSNPSVVPPSTPEYLGNGPEVGADGMVTDFKRHGNKFLLKVSLKQPAWVLISSMGSRERDGNRGLPEDEFHAELSSMVVSALAACLNCHTAHPHPVNVTPKHGMKVSTEYPTLPDGRITCCSCHEPHGSNYFYLTRRNYKTALCNGCHKVGRKEENHEKQFKRKK